MGMASVSLLNCLDVVPELTTAWNPEHAPHATVMKSIGHNGKTEFGMYTGALIKGLTIRIPINPRIKIIYI